MKRQLNNQDQTAVEQLAEGLSRAVFKGAVIELVGDVGAGKTTFTKAFAKALGIQDTVHSPTFTIENRYQISDGRTLLHYDFYRLDDPGIMKNELAEALEDESNIVVIEWADIVDGVLPSDRLTIQFETPSETSRNITLLSGGSVSDQLLEVLK